MKKDVEQFLGIDAYTTWTQSLEETKQTVHQRFDEAEELTLETMRAAMRQLRAAAVQPFAGQLHFRNEAGQWQPVQHDHIKAMEDALAESDRILAHWK